MDEIRGSEVNARVEVRDSDPYAIEDAHVGGVNVVAAGVSRG